MRSRTLKAVVGASLTLPAVLLAGTALGQRRTAKAVSELRGSATPRRDAAVTADDLAGLPTPVREYFDTVLREGQAYVDSVHLEQEGELRLDAASESWNAFTAWQYVTVSPPGFFWDASVSVAPFVSLRIRDLFRDGDGTASVSAFGYPFDSADPSPELNEGELIRYLAEAVWYPTALLPREGVQWDPVDERRAEATIEHAGAAASLTFTFAESGEVTAVHADERPRRVDGGYVPTPWTGRWHDYEWRDGMRVPTAGAVTWHLPDGDVEAWRGRLTDIRYDAW